MPRVTTQLPCQLCLRLKLIITSPSTKPAKSCSIWPHLQPHASNPQMAETAPAPSPPTPPPPPPGPKLSGFEQLDTRIKELTSSQGGLLDRIRRLKLEVQNWRSNLETQVKTCQNELLEQKNGLNSEVEQLKSEIKEISSAIQDEKGSLPTQFTDSEKSNDGTKQIRQAQDQALKIDIGDHMEQQTAMQA